MFALIIVLKKAEKKCRCLRTKEKEDGQVAVPDPSKWQLCNEHIFSDSEKGQTQPT